MDSSGDKPLNWRSGLAAVGHAWQPLLIYELGISLLATAVLGPWLLACLYELIALTEDASLGDWNLLPFVLSPIGAVALVLGAGVALGLLFVEYSGLILLAGSALRGTSLSRRQLLTRLLTAAPRLFAIAAGQASLLLLVALPFAAAAWATYSLLLGNADINFYVEARPPRFWFAIAIGIVLAIGLAISTSWLCLRWALAVPACILDDQAWLPALRSSALLIRGRAVRLLLLICGWELLKQVALVLAIVGLDYVNEAWLAHFELGLDTLVWSTVALLLLDALVLQLVAALFAIGLAVLIAYEYERARRLQPDCRPTAGYPEPSLRPAQLGWRQRTAVWAAVLATGPVVALLSALALQQDLVEHRSARVTAHRAGPKQAPENSLAALQLALAARADFVEIDVQSTRDGQVVLLHDRDLRRVTGDARNLADVSLADLADLRLAHGGASSDQGVPTLAGFLAACDERIQLNIELKDFGQSQGLPAAVVKVLREQHFTGRAIISSFQLRLLDDVRRAEPDLPVGIILSTSKGDITRLDVDFLSLNQRQIRAEVVRRAHRRGMEMHAWTVNDREAALRLLDLGCDNLITSDPAKMRDIVGWYAELTDMERMFLRLRRWMRE